MHTAAPLPSNGRLRILVVDDNPMLRRGLRDMLSLWGRATVSTAADGLEAKTVLRLEPIDVVLTDWAMAPVSGAALLEWIRRSDDGPRRDLPVLVLTGQADVATVRAAWDAGADAVLAKPASATAIARRIEEVLRRPRRHAFEPDTPMPAGTAPAPGDPLFPGLEAPNRAAVLAATRRAAIAGPDDPLRLPLPGTGTPERQRRRLRLLIALDRLEALAAQPLPDRDRLRDAAAAVRDAADDPLTEELASALAACVLEMHPGDEGFAEAMAAHLGAFRWALAADDRNPGTRRNLLVCLRATVRALANRRRPPQEHGPAPDDRRPASRPGGLPPGPLPS
ncbi:response regulator [Azospirillum halopraeferens]|uniref:response regulator n=1 Tax=Azospirillum halopraeferens TaxID=34010 RepID=UPI0004245980|nr:response regulator [Azospirillum halopraeferens]